MARGFVAVVPPAPVLDVVASTADRLRAACPSRARWAPRSQWHLTLHFLGNHVDLDETAAMLGTVEFAPFDVQLGGVGAFSRPSRATVLWIGVAVGCAPLVELAAAVSGATAAIAPIDDKPYRPHLTVARFDRPADVRALVRRPGGPDEGVVDQVGPAWRAAEIVLFESRLGRGPADHQVHARFAATL